MKKLSWSNFHTYRVSPEIGSSIKTDTIRSLQLLRFESTSTLTVFWSLRYSYMNTHITYFTIPVCYEVDIYENKLEYISELHASFHCNLLQFCVTVYPLRFRCDSPIQASSSNIYLPRWQIHFSGLNFVQKSNEFKLLKCYIHYYLIQF